MILRRYCIKSEHIFGKCLPNNQYMISCNVVMQLVKRIILFMGVLTLLLIAGCSSNKNIEALNKENNELISLLGKSYTEPDAGDEFKIAVTATLSEYNYRHNVVINL